MSLPPRSRQPRRVDDKDNDYRRLPPADHRSGYDGFHPGYTPTYYPGDAVRSLYAPSYHRGLPPTGHRHRYDDRRQRSPRSSFLDPVPLGTSNTNDGQREINVDDNVRRYAAWSDAVNEARGVQILNAGAAAKAELQNSNKRPASSSDLITEHENSPKRQRQHPRDASSLLKENQRPTTSSMGHTFVETKGGQAPGQADRKQQLATGKLLALHYRSSQAC